MDPAVIGFTKEAGLKQFAGRVIKGVGRAVGHSGMEAKGFKMQHGRALGDVSRTPGGFRRAAEAAKAKAAPPPKRSAPKKPTPKMELVIPHNTTKNDRRKMLGLDKAKDEYTTPHGLRKRKD